ncbi:peptide deformylase [Mycobacterium sp. URHB0021]
MPVGANGSLPLGLAGLIDDLYESLAASKGAGLSANQIGADLRVFVYDCPEVRSESRRHRGCVVNPALEIDDWPAGPPDPDSDEEGCLSVPGEKFPTGRANWARVTGLDTDGEPVTVEGTGLIALMLQHEIGHLDGQLYIDRLVAPYAARAADAVPHMAGVSRASPGRQTRCRSEPIRRIAATCLSLCGRKPADAPTRGIFATVNRQHAGC